jgi:polyhydroxyalkanoate synthesis regulator phasin
MTRGGEGTVGYVYTEETRQQISDSLKKYAEENPNAGKEIGVKIKKFFEENPTAGKINSERQKKYYKDNPIAIEKQSENSKKQFENPEARRKLSDGKGQNKPFDVFTIDGTLIGTFTYQFEAREYLKKEHDIATNIKISCVLAGKRNNSHGFLFKYKTI